MSTVNLFNLSVNRKQAIRDGLTGPYARILLPFYQYGYWFASGQQYDFSAGSEIQQKKGLTMQPTRKNTPYLKADGICW